MKRPVVTVWLTLYCAVMLVLLAIGLTVAVMMIFAPEVLLEGDSAFRQNPAAAVAIMQLFGGVLAILCGAPMLPMLAAIVWPRGRFTWYIGVIAIIAGFFTMIGWLGTLPLLWAWNQPHVKTYYGVMAPTPAGSAKKRADS